MSETADAASPRVDPALPIRPIDQPARLTALEAAVRARTPLVPEVGIVLGSGLGGLADDLVDPVAIPFSDLPGWPAATAPGHVGRLLLGFLGGRPVVMLQGRFHLYEGNDPGLVVQPVLLFARRGARVVILTNAAGGLDPSFGPGTLMVMSDHINLTGRSPLMGPNADELGPRFPDLTDAWSPRLRARLHRAAAAENESLEEGVYEASDIVCQASKWEEAFGWTIAEAMAFSKPLVATRVGAVPELVEDNVTGLLVDRDDMAGMAVRILRLAGDADLRAAMGAAGRRAVEQRFDLAENIRQHVALYTGGLNQSESTLGAAREMESVQH